MEKQAFNKPHGKQGRTADVLDTTQALEDVSIPTLFLRVFSQHSLVPACREVNTE